MSSQAAFSNIESLRSWFFQIHRPWFTLYKGFGKNPGDRLLAHSPDVKKGEDISDENLMPHWELLKKTILDNKQPGARLTIFLPDSPGVTVGFTSHFEFSPIADSLGSPMGSGNSYLSDQLLIYDLKRKLEDKEKEANEGLGANRLMNKLIDHPAIDALLMGGVAKLGFGINPAAGVGQPGANANTEPKALTPQENERLKVALYKLSAYFPNDFVGTIEGIAETLKTNPELIGVLSTLVPKKEGQVNT